MFDLRFYTPSTFILAGASQSGKTTFVLNLLRQIDSYFANPKCKQNVIYYFKEWQEALELFQNEDIVTQWINELPTAEEFKNKTLPYKDGDGSIVVIDDFGQELNSDIQDIFTVLSHHTNTTVFLLVQNIFPKNRVFRDISLKSTYIVLFKNPRDASQISHYARQFAPGNHHYIVDAFRECTKNAYSYMIFDHHQATPDILRVRSHIFQQQGPLRIWLSKTCII